MSTMTGSDEPLSCAAALDLLEPFVDGDLDAAEEARLRAHLLGCASCAAELALAERVQRELRSLPQPECPPELLARVVQAGRGEVVPFRAPLRTSRRTERLRVTAAAALVALAVGGGSLFVHLQHVQQQRAQVAQATREARLALAYFGKVARRTSLDIRDEVLQKRLVIPVTRDASQSLSRVTDAAGEPRKEL
jgi:anti-sigma factor (TIGR02949 family)